MQQFENVPGRGFIDHVSEFRFRTERFLSMAEMKTKKTGDSVQGFLDSIPDEQMREDSYLLLKMMEKATGSTAKMWGTSIVGFGDHHYVYESGREGDWFLAGFSPRKQALTLYLAGGLSQHSEAISKLGKVKTGKGCLYIKRLSDIDLKSLGALITHSVKATKKMSG